jgi:hypothetical protein
MAGASSAANMQGHGNGAPTGDASSQHDVLSSSAPQEPQLHADSLEMQQDEFAEATLHWHGASNNGAAANAPRVIRVVSLLRSGRRLLTITTNKHAESSRLSHFQYALF